MAEAPDGTDTIVALATPPGIGALAVIRVSGPESVSLVNAVYSGTRALTDVRGFHGVHGRILDEAGTADEVVVWVYRAPKTYTGEDLVEISCHGGPVPARRVLEALWKAGGRPARPGEFTRRAFLNGRIDLAQAEAVVEVIQAQGRLAETRALVQLEGGLSRRIRELGSNLRAVLARTTVFLDFDEDVPEPPDTEALAAVVTGGAASVAQLLRSHRSSFRLRDGVTIALVGRPNVGKSSLLNALVGRDRAIVHETPGTTRDFVEDVVEWEGVPVRLIDTAGLRDESSAVEAVGIERARREAKQADLLLWVVDGSTPIGAEDRRIGQELESRKLFIVLNKSDLGTRDIEWVNNYSPLGRVCVSALTGAGLEALREILGAWLREEAAGGPDAEAIWVTSDRHAELLNEVLACLERTEGVFASGRPLELAAADLTRALKALGAITGDEVGPELLDEIFSRFCIGK